MSTYQMKSKPTYQDLENKIQNMEQQFIWFNMIGDIAQDWIVITDVNAKIIYISTFCEMITGYSPADFYTNPDLLTKIIIDDDQLIYQQHLQIYAESPNQTLEIVYRITTKTGEQKIIKHRCKILKDNNGVVIGRQASNTDITDKYQSDLLLAKSEARLKRAENLAQIGHLEINWNERKTIASDQLLRFFEWTKKDGVPTYTSIVSKIHADDRAEFLLLLESCYKNSTSYMRVRVPFQNNLIKYFSVNISHEFSTYKHSFFTLCTLQDITDLVTNENKLKLSEEKYKSLIDTMQEGVVMQSITGEIITCNEAAEEILGLTESQMCGKTSIDPSWRSIHEDGSDFPGNTHPAMVSLATGEVQRNIIMGVQKPNNELTWIIVNSVPIFGTDWKKPIAVVATFTDITEQKNTEKKLRELVSTKDKMLSIIGHDLKNPFNSLMGMSQLLENALKKNTLDRAHIYVRSIKTASNQAYILLCNLLDWANSQIGNIKVQRNCLDLDTVLKQVEMLLETSLDQKQVSFKRFGFPNLQLYCDANMIETVLRNLISNAIKFSNPHGMIKLTAVSQDDEVIIMIKDQGKGMSEEQMNKLFSSNEIFTTRGTSGESGSGLGLKLCKEFVELNHGQLTINSVENEGTTVTITLPVFNEKLYSL